MLRNIPWASCFDLCPIHLTNSLFYQRLDYLTLALCYRFNQSTIITASILHSFVFFYLLFQLMGLVNNTRGLSRGNLSTPTLTFDLLCQNILKSINIGDMVRAKPTFCLTYHYSAMGYHTTLIIFYETRYCTISARGQHQRYRRFVPWIGLPRLDREFQISV